MPNPKQRHSNSRTNSRRAHHALKGVTLGVCAKCGASLKPHNACPVCGDYKGNDTKKKVVPVKKTATALKKEAKTAKKTKVAKTEKKAEKK